MKILLLIILFCPFISAMAQDTIVLLSGDKVPVKEFTINDKANLVEFKNKRGKDKFIEMDYIFCIKKADGTELLIYTESVFEDDSISVDEMRDFVNGAITSRENYHAPFATATGFVVGAGSVFLFPELGLPVFYSPVVPGAYTAIIGAITPNQNKIIEKYPEALNKPYFLAGYTEMAKEKRINNAVTGSLAGIAAMVITAIIFSK